MGNVNKGSNGTNMNEKKINLRDFLKPESLKWNNEQYNLTLFLAVCLGVFGVHRFMHKKYITGIIMLVTFGGLFVWVFIDIYLIISRKFKDADGNILFYGGEFYEHPPNLLAICLSIVIFSGCTTFISNMAEENKSKNAQDTNEIVQTVEVEQTEVAEEVQLEVEEPTKEIETSSSYDVPEGEIMASADITGKFSSNAHLADSDIIIENASIKQTAEERYYEVGWTLRNNNAIESYKNAVVKITINNRKGNSSKHIATVLINEELKPGESKDFTEIRDASDDVSDVDIELVSYEGVN